MRPELIGLFMIHYDECRPLCDSLGLNGCGLGGTESSVNNINKGEIFLLLMHMGVLPACVSVQHLYTMSSETRTGRLIFWKWHYRQLRASMWMPAN